MSNVIKAAISGCVALLCTLTAYAQDTYLSDSDGEIYHRISAEFRPEHIFGTNSFVRGNNENGTPISNAYSGHIGYSFQYSPGSEMGRVYGSSYQGVGLSLYSFTDKHELGNPVDFYVFQGATLFGLKNRRFNVNYEWGFGISAGWHTFDAIQNPYNGCVGSNLNAYLNVGVYMNLVLSRHVDIIAGGSLTHFSNGNTKFPNGGINNGGARIGLAYYINRELPSAMTAQSESHAIQPFTKYLCYDILLFGSWRHGSAAIDGRYYAVRKIYSVAGLNFAPMYAFNYRFRAGVSLDLQYDGSGNLIVDKEAYSDLDNTIDNNFISRPKIGKQIATGLSVKAEYIMPYFTIAAGIGNNLIYSNGDMKGFYQTLALKIKLSHSAYLNVGYNLKNFKTPNHLMLGIGYRFHDLYPHFF